MDRRDEPHADFIVFRAAADAPPGFLPDGAVGVWLDRRHVPVIGGRCDLGGVDCELVAAGRFETRDEDGAVAEVWEVRPASALTPYPQPPDEAMHAMRAHPDFEYATTKGPRKGWYDYDVPPEGDGWEPNVDVGSREGWMRFDHHEESYWRRRRP